jgi:hypothetical protein
LVSSQDFVEAGKIIILAFLLQAGRDDIAQATSEGARMIKRAKAVVDGHLSTSTQSNADALAMYGLLREDLFLEHLTKGNGA